MYCNYDFRFSSFREKVVKLKPILRRIAGASLSLHNALIIRCVCF